MPNDKYLWTTIHANQPLLGMGMGRSENTVQMDIYSIVF